MSASTKTHYVVAVDRKTGKPKAVASLSGTRKWCRKLVKRINRQGFPVKALVVPAM